MTRRSKGFGIHPHTGRMGWMTHRKWKEIKQQPSMLPGPAVPGSCLASFHFLWAIHPIRPVEKQARERGGRRVSSSSFAPGRREELPFSRRSFIPFSFRAGNEITGCAEKAWPHSTTHICLTQVCSAGSNVDDGLFLATVSYAHLLVSPFNGSVPL